MMARLFLMLYLHFNKHIQNISEFLNFRKERIEGEGGYTEAHKYLLSCMDSEKFISQILTILKRKKKRNPAAACELSPERFSCGSIWELYNCICLSFIQWKQEQDLPHAVFRLVACSYL